MRLVFLQILRNIYNQIQNYNEFMFSAEIFSLLQFPPICLYEYLFTHTASLMSMFVIIKPEHIPNKYHFNFVVCYSRLIHSNVGRMLFEPETPVLIVRNPEDIPHKSRFNIFSSLFMRNPVGMLHVTQMLFECRTPIFFCSKSRRYSELISLQYFQLVIHA